ncbi:hypothetical protein ACROYT_G035440 [Oculina patagonica]
MSPVRTTQHNDIGKTFEHKDDIDRIMLLHGARVMESVKPILDSENRTEDVKEQALCVIANIANGSSAKEFVMRDESLLKRLMHYMMNDSVKLQMAATYCVSNLTSICLKG